MSRLDEIRARDKEIVEKIRELENERNKLKAEKIDIKKNENKKWLDYLMENKDFVLSLFEHSRPSCSDKEYCNGIENRYGAYMCPKCALIEILNNRWGSTFKPVFSINIVRVEDY